MREVTGTSASAPPSSFLHAIANLATCNESPKKRTAPIHAATKSAPGAESRTTRPRPGSPQTRLTNKKSPAASLFPMTAMTMRSSPDAAPPAPGFSPSRWLTSDRCSLNPSAVTAVRIQLRRRQSIHAANRAVRSIRLGLVGPIGALAGLGVIEDESVADKVNDLRQLQPSRWTTRFRVAHVRQ